MTKSEQGRHRERHDPHWIEWLTGAVSALLVAAMIGWVGWQAMTRTASPPDLFIAIAATGKAAAGYRVAFDIRNAGTTTAAAVTVVGTLADGRTVIEEAQVTFDYVAAESTASGALLFARDPANHRLDIRPVGYTAP